MPNTLKLPALSAKDIADAYGIPAQLLAKILQRLTKTGLLRSHAGMNGGYALARDARQISAFRGDPCHRRAAVHHLMYQGAKGCDLPRIVPSKNRLARVNDTIAGVLKSISISRSGRSRIGQTVVRWEGLRTG